VSIDKKILGKENIPGTLPRIVSSIETPAFQCGTCSKHFRAGMATLHNSPPICPSHLSKMVTTTDANNCTHPSLPPFQSPTTDPTSPSTDNKEVIVLGVVSPLAGVVHANAGQNVTPHNPS
jgi:hypothetical protein